VQEGQVGEQWRPVVVEVAFDADGVRGVVVHRSAPSRGPAVAR
jgi:hypothetical protein